MVPIPASASRLKTRGFNQAELIARKLSKHLGMTAAYDLLQRHKDTHAQHSYGRRQRFYNISGAFGVRGALGEHKNILLVDDICTSGATFFEAAQTLYRAGAARIVCFALSHKL